MDDILPEMNGAGPYTPYLWWEGDQDSNGRLVSYGLGYDFQGVLQGNAKIVSSWGNFQQKYASLLCSVWIL